MYSILSYRTSKFYFVGLQNITHWLITAVSRCTRRYVLLKRLHQCSCNDKTRDWIWKLKWHGNCIFVYCWSICIHCWWTLSERQILYFCTIIFKKLSCLGRYCNICCISGSRAEVIFYSSYHFIFNLVDS